MTYRAYIESVLRYGIVLWGNGTDWNRAFIAQKKCIRAVAGIRTDESCEPIFKDLGLLPFPSLYIYEICNFVNNNMHLFKKSCETQNSRSRRDPYRLVLNDIPKSTKYGKSCLAMCVRIYNNIPKDLKDFNKSLFKNKLYKWLNVNNFYSLKQFFDTSGR